MALNDAFLKALGRISANFQALEMYIAAFTWSLISSDQNVGQIVTSQISFSRLCDLLSSLFRHKVKSPDLIEELDGILQRASEAEQQRNTIIHSAWLTDEEDTDKSPSRFKITSKRKKGFDIQVEDTDADKLNEIADLLRDVAKEIIPFMSRVKERGYIDFPTKPPE